MIGCKLFVWEQAEGRLDQVVGFMGGGEKGGWL